MTTPRSAATELQIFADRVIGSSVPRQVGAAFATNDESGHFNVRRRWGVVTAVNTSTPTVDVRVDGVIIPEIARVAWYQPLVGETVIVEYSGTDQVVMGPVGLSAKNVFSQATHTHPPSKTPPAVGTVRLPNPGVGGFSTSLNRIVIEWDVANIQLAGVAATSVSQTITAPGNIASAGSQVPLNEQVQQLRLQAHAYPVNVILKTDNTPNAYAGPANLGTFTVAKDTITRVGTAFDDITKRWHLTSLVAGIPVPNVRRPTVTSLTTGTGVARTITVTTPSDTPFGAQILVFHTNDWGVPGDMLSPTGTSSDWTLVRSSGIDYSCHCNLWTRTVTTGGAQTIIVNSTSVYANNVLVYVVSDALPLVANDVYSKAATTPPSTTAHAYSMPEVSVPDCLFVGVIGMSDAGSMSGGYYGGVHVGVAGAPSPTEVVAGDTGGNYHTSNGMSRWFDNPSGSNPQAVGGIFSIAVASAFTSAVLRPSSSW